MKISLIIGSFYPAVRYGGPIFSTLFLSRQLARRGICVNVLTTNTNYDDRLDVVTGKFTELEENLFVKYYGWANRKGFSLPMLFNMWRDIKSSDVVLIQPVFAPYAAIALMYAKLFKKPVLISPRGNLMKWCLQEGSRFKKAWLRIFIEPFVDYIHWHATSQQEERMIKSIYKNASVYRIPNGINAEEYDSSNALTPRDYIKKFSKSDTICGNIIVSMGRLHKVKGFDILVDAFNRIRENLPDAVLLIAGEDAGERGNLLRKIQRLNLENRIFLVGQISGQDKVDFISNADIFVLPSHNESFGIVYLEALAAGTPIIASRNTPWKEIENHNCGYWIENTPEEVSKAIEAMLNADYKEMGNRGKEYSHNEFEWGNIAGKFAEIFDLLVSKKNSGRFSLQHP